MKKYIKYVLTFVPVIFAPAVFSIAPIIPVVPIMPKMPAKAPKTIAPKAPTPPVAKTTTPTPAAPAKGGASGTSFSLSIGSVDITNLSNQDAKLNAMTIAYSVNDKNISTKSKFTSNNTIPANTADDLRMNPNILTFSPSITITAPVGTKVEFTGIVQFTIDNQKLDLAQPLKTNSASSSTVASRYYIKKVKGKWKLVPQEVVTPPATQPGTPKTVEDGDDVPETGTDVGTAAARNAAAVTLLKKEGKLPKQTVEHVEKSKTSKSTKSTSKALATTKVADPVK